jgi:hypothetical protein
LRRVVRGAGREDEAGDRQSGATQDAAFS